MEPFEVLADDTGGLPVVPLPPDLARIYGGELGLAEDCVFANFVATLDGVVAIPSVPGSNALIAGDNDADRFLMGVLRAHDLEFRDVRDVELRDVGNVHPARMQSRTGNALHSIERPDFHGAELGEIDLRNLGQHQWPRHVERRARYVGK